MGSIDRRDLFRYSFREEIIMKQQIHDTILSILAEKRADGEVLPFATSIEVAHRMKIGAWQVEKIAKGIEGIVKGRTLNYEWYHE